MGLIEEEELIKQIKELHFGQDRYYLLLFATKPTFIFPHLLIGNRSQARDIKKLESMGVSHVINMASEKPSKRKVYPKGWEYLEFNAIDSSSYDILQHFDAVYDFIETKTLLNQNVLIHCEAGVSRSATIVIAYTMKKMGWNLLTAYKYVLEKRPSILPNDGFLRQLVKFQKTQQTRLTQQHQHQHQHQRQHQNQPKQQTGDYVEINSELLSVSQQSLLQKQIILFQPDYSNNTYLLMQA